MGPYKIINVRGNDRYEVKKIGDFEGPVITFSSADLMKPWSDDDSADSTYEDTFEANVMQDDRVE